MFDLPDTCRWAEGLLRQNGEDDRLWLSALLFCVVLPETYVLWPVY